MLLQADALAALPLADGSVHMCVTSPPYWGLRDYGVAGQIGLEPTPDEYVAHMVSVFREVWRVLRDDGTCWLNLGDSYASDTKGTGGPSEKQLSNAGSRYEVRKLNHSLKPKDLVGIPWRVAFALQADGWYLRSDIIWAKLNPMPESVTDRPTKAHEYLFLLAKRERYYYDAEAVKEPAEQSSGGWQSRARSGKSTLSADTLRNSDRNDSGECIGDGRAESTRNRRSVWTIPTQPTALAHFATFPPALVEPCILAGTSARGCCSVCGAPWERVTERVAGDRADKSTPKHEVMNNAGTGRNSHPPGWRKMTADLEIATGWRPTCSHDAPTVPAVVLDPFCGSGTVGAVARLHGRRFVGLDISATYLRELALPRAEGKSTAASMATLPLFARAGELAA